MTVAFYFELMAKYHKIPKIGPRAYIFQRPFLRGLFLGCLYLEGRFNRGFFCVTGLGGFYWEGLIFGILQYTMNDRF